MIELQGVSFITSTKECDLAHPRHQTNGIIVKARAVKSQFREISAARPCLERTLMGFNDYNFCDSRVENADVSEIALVTRVLLHTDVREPTRLRCRQ